MAIFLMQPIGLEGFRDKEVSLPLEVLLACPDLEPLLFPTPLYLD